MSHQHDLTDPELDVDDPFLDADSWTHVTADGRTIRAILVGRWVVSVWFAGEMLELWEDKPYGTA